MTSSTQNTSVIAVFSYQPATLDFIYEGHFRSNENVIVLAYSIVLTSKTIYQRKHQPSDI